MKKLFIIVSAVILSTGAVFALPAIPAVSGAAKIAIGATSATVGAIAGNELPKILSKSGTGESTKYEVTKTDLTILENGQTMKGEIRGYSTLKDVVDRIVSSTGGRKINRENAPSALQKNNIPQERAHEIAMSLPSGQGSRGQVNQTKNEKTGRSYSQGDVVGLWVAPFIGVYADTPEGACKSNVDWSSGRPECLDASGKPTRIFPTLKETTITETDGTLCGSRISGASFLCGTAEAVSEVDGREALVETLTDSDIQRVLQAMRSLGLLGGNAVTFNLPSGRVLTVGSQGEVTIGDRPALPEELAQSEKEATVNSPVEGKPSDEDIMPDADIDIPTVDASFEYKTYITAGKSGCFQPAQFSVLGTQFEIPFDKMCESLSLVGYAFYAAALFISGRILLK